MYRPGLEAIGELGNGKKLSNACPLLFIRAVGIDRLREVTDALQGCRDGYGNRIGRRNRVGFLHRDKEERLVPQQRRSTFSKPRERQGSTESEARNLVTIKRL